MIDSISNPAKKTTLRQAFHAWYLSPELKPRTVEAYLNALHHWEGMTEDPLDPVTFPADPDIHSITNLHLAKFKTAFLREHSAATFNKIRAHLLAVLNRLGPVQKHNPEGLGILSDFVFTSRAREQDRQPRMASDAELTAIYQAAGQATWPKFPQGAAAWWQALLVFLFNTGLRRNDFLRLRMQDLDLDHHCFQFRAEKTGKLRTLPLHPAAVEHLRNIWSERDLVFPKPRGNRSLYQHWHKLQTAAGLPLERHLTFHQLRSTCGSRLFQQSPGAAQEMLGHSSIETTRRSYATTSEQLVQLATQAQQPAAFQQTQLDPEDPTDPGNPDILRFPA